MTRIVAGQAGGRTLRVPPKGTRPTTERVREALFSALDAADEVAGVRVLDLYSGSGALGLEALSRGAREAVFVEADRTAAEVLRGNIARVGLGGQVREGRAETVVAVPPPEPFDLVLADPPYAVDAETLGVVLGRLVDNGWLADGALVVMERRLHDGPPHWPDALRVLRTREYGDNALFRAEYRV
ncbi:16S rRNA (guanine(966)-N(2))-methyltransferase RsmD [Saccharomonospora piscinae]|uniref:16S rRNA (guanine(966)-N(2))-methyltransferase RsmD n=1 Tax=Saccharomonospora piscinae TaxID=687388 RepID=UPI001106D006|nr:16S rRNA (guanine(966)-N(2))-methyltransferase RsmD [Saccharomonospora piscinae]TLW90886.1 16S rRNA (guanine(966)-N(2))-methyltransferase RsmD [Saccharomonospora piscinae]